MSLTWWARVVAETVLLLLRFRQLPILVSASMSWKGVALLYLTYNPHGLVVSGEVDPGVTSRSIRT